MITDIEDYFTLGCGRCARFATPECSTRLWIDGLNALRTICRDMGLVEEVKWAHPCYMHAGRNIAILGAFRTDFRLSFFNAALMKDPEGVLARQGENTRHPDMIRFTASDQVAEKDPIIRAYLEEAKGYAEAGIKPEREKTEIDMPEELIDAMDADPELAEAFHALTPGRQKSYLFNLNGAKKSETRIARIAKFRDKIIAGKGAMEY
ncbi:YdeI family protein [Pelagibacterium halotolerans]|uniref:YdeI/OmpD-associated family protein n=1 Tax=Pelagibacterium halotolerans TaxID=531813 RepID=UPI00384E416F